MEPLLIKALVLANLLLVMVDDETLVPISWDPVRCWINPC